MAAQENPGDQKAQSKLIENDLWDLDDDEDIQDDTPESSENPSAADGRQSANETETTDQAEAERHLAEKAPAEENIPETPAPAPTEGIDPTSGDDELPEIEGREELDALENIDKPTPEPEIPEQEPAEPPRKTEKKPSFLSRFKPAEKAGLGLFLLFLIGLCIWLAASFLPPGKWITEKAPQTSFPAKGQNLAVQSVQTAWRAPKRKGEQRDRDVRLDTRLIPVADITLEGTGSGSLRFVFQNDEGDPIGDTITEEISQGQFSNATNEIEIHSTDGLDDASLFNNYRQGQIRPWTLTAYEFDTSDQGGEALFTVEITPSLKK